MPLPPKPLPLLLLLMLLLPPCCCLRHSRCTTLCLFGWVERAYGVFCRISIEAAIQSIGVLCTAHTSKRHNKEESFSIQKQQPQPTRPSRACLRVAVACALAHARDGPVIVGMRDVLYARGEAEHAPREGEGILEERAEMSWMAFVDIGEGGGGDVAAE